MLFEADKVMFEIYRETEYTGKYKVCYFTELQDHNKETEINRAMAGEHFYDGFIKNFRKEEAKEIIELLLRRLNEGEKVDAKEVERGLKTESRIGPRAYLGPGSAFAGGTLARDVSFLVDIGHQKNLQTSLLQGVRTSNDAHKLWPRLKLNEVLGTLLNLSGTIVNSVVGLSSGGIGRLLARQPLVARLLNGFTGIVFLGLAARLVLADGRPK